MLQKRNDLEIVEILRKGDSYIRQIAKTLGQMPSTVQRILKRLEKEKVVDSRLQGKNKIYFLKNTLDSQVYLRTAENYKFLKLIQKPAIKSIVKKILEITCNELVVVFGSYAKGLEKGSSDVDIYVETESKVIRKKIGEINSKVSVKIGKFDKESLLGKEIIEDHVIVQNVDKFYRLIE